MNHSAFEDSSYLKTVGRSLEMLELVGAHPGLTLSEAARQAGMSTTVAYRILFTLTTAGFLQQAADSKRYYPGDKALLLGFQAMDAQEIKRISQYYMWNCYEQTGENCILTVPCANRSLCIEKISSPLRDSSSVMRAGSLYPLHRGASNRVLLAFLPHREQQDYLDGLALAPTEHSALQGLLDLARERGYDYSVGLLTPGRFGLAFPLFDRSRRLVGGFSTGGDLANCAGEPQEALVRKFRQVADQINLALGGPVSFEQDL